MKKRKNKITGKVYEYLTEVYGESSAKQYLNFVQEHPSVYVRVNTLKISRDTLVEKLSDRYGIETDQFDVLPDALKFNEQEEDLGKTLEIALGYYYIQGFSSMLPPLVLNPSANEKVLDLCSAPGSKTTQIAELMSNKGTLIVNDIQLDRIKALVYNLDRLNIAAVTCAHAQEDALPVQIVLVRVVIDGDQFACLARVCSAGNDRMSEQRIGGGRIEGELELDLFGLLRRLFSGHWANPLLANTRCRAL